MAMGGPKSTSPSSSDHRQWQRIFGTLVEMLQSQQSQIETLADDLSRVSLRNRYIFLGSQMKKEERKGRRVQETWLDLMVGMKEREALYYKKQYELGESDLEDFRACVETLCAEISELKEKLRSGKVDNGGTRVSRAKLRENLKEAQKSTTALEGEARKLKHAFQRLSSKKEAESTSALLAEKYFVWNQLKNMESDYTGLLKIERTEVEQAKEAMEKLHRDLEKLQSSANEKDGTIAGLEAEKANLELGITRKTQEAEQGNEAMEKLRRDLEKLQSSANEKDETIAGLEAEKANLELGINNLRRRRRFGG